MAVFKNTVIEICELYEKGESVLAIAEKFKKFGMTVKTIEYVLKNYSVEEVL